MPGVTIFFVIVIVVCTTFIILFNQIAAKLGQLESKLKELEAQLKKEFILKQQPEISREEEEQIVDLVKSARQSYITAVAVYNESIASFPGMLIAGMFGFRMISEGDDIRVPDSTSDDDIS